MKILSNQWKCHDPTGTYWPAVQECYTLMTVGNVPRNIPATTTDVDQAAPSANLQRCINRSHDAGTVVDVDQTASAIYNDSHSRQLPSDISVVDSTSTWRSNVHERNEHSYLSEARVLKSTPSLKTVDSLSCTGENESSKGFDPTMLRSFRTTNSREHAASKHASKSVSVAE